MLTSGNCIVFKKEDRTIHLEGMGGSDCSYYPWIDPRQFPSSREQSGHATIIHPIVIGVRDFPVEPPLSTGPEIREAFRQTLMECLHAHAGTVVAYVAQGVGWLWTAQDKSLIKLPIAKGDWFVIPPHTPHLSVAQPGTEMLEVGTYHSTPDDPQISLGVELDGVTLG